MRLSELNLINSILLPKEVQTLKCKKTLVDKKLYEFVYQIVFIYFSFSLPSFYAIEHCLNIR